MMGMQTQIPEEVFVEKAIWDAVHRHLRSIFTRDVDTYQETTGEDLSLYEWFVTPHRLDGLEFHRFMIESNWSAVGERWRYDLLEPRLQRYGDAAIVSYTFMLTQETSQGVKQTTHNESRVLIRQDGNWKVVHVHKSPAWQAPLQPSC